MVRATRGTQLMDLTPSPPKCPSPGQAPSETASSRPRDQPQIGGPNALPATSHCSAQSRQMERDAIVIQLVEGQRQMQRQMRESREEFRRELHQMALSVARIGKSLIDDEVAGLEAAVSMDQPPPPPPPVIQQRTVPTAPRTATHQTGVCTLPSGPVGRGSGRMIRDSTSVVAESSRPHFEIGEGSNRSVTAREDRFWQYARFTKNGRRPFLGKPDAEEAFLWISSAVGVFKSMACPDHHRSTPG